MTLKQWLVSTMLFTSLVACGTNTPPVEDLSNTQTRAGLVHSILSASTFKCMDVANGSMAMGGLIVQFGCHGGLAQQFVLDSVVAPIVRIRNVNSNLCITPTGYRGYSTASMQLVQSSCNTPYANFTLENRVPTSSGTTLTVTIRWAYDSAYCIDVPSGARIDSLILQAYPCHGGLNQRWTIR